MLEKSHEKFSEIFKSINGEKCGFAVSGLASTYHRSVCVAKCFGRVGISYQPRRNLSKNRFFVSFVAAFHVVVVVSYVACVRTRARPDCRRKPTAFSFRPKKKPLFGENNRTFTYLRSRAPFSAVLFTSCGPSRFSRRTYVENGSRPFETVPIAGRGRRRRRRLSRGRARCYGSHAGTPNDGMRASAKSPKARKSRRAHARLPCPRAATAIFFSRRRRSRVTTTSGVVFPVFFPMLFGERGRAGTCSKEIGRWVQAGSPLAKRLTDEKKTPADIRDKIYRQRKERVPDILPG